MRGAPETCPQCGADVPRGARSCPDCGSDEQTGWSERAVEDRLELPGDGGFDYDDYVRREFGGRDGGGGKRGGRRGDGRAWVWWVALAVLVALIVAWVL